MTAFVAAGSEDQRKKADHEEQPDQKDDADRASYEFQDASYDGVLRLFDLVFLTR